MKQLIPSWRIALLAVAVAPLAATAQTSAVAHALTAAHCAITVLRVALAPNQPATQSIAGTLCTPLNAASGYALDVLVHGAAYDQSYWDSPFESPSYSYVDRTLQAGRATFAYDRLGVGASGPLASGSVTMDADAYVLHQILQHFRPRFRTINLIGHSYGSRIAQLESARYNDASRLVLTGHLHAVGPALTKGAIVLHPANQDPQFAGRGLDSGWTTTTPGAARAAFYYLPGADSNEVAYDDAHKAIVSAPEFQQGIAIGRIAAGSNVSDSITRPVLLVSGEEDALACGLALDCRNGAAVRANEEPYYSSAASLTVIMIPDTGHDLALHLSAGASFEAINRWLRQQ